MVLQKPAASIKGKEGQPPAAITKTSTKLRIAGILPESLVDGPGVRSVLFIQGCTLKCEDCHSPSTWDVKEGREQDIGQIAKELLKSDKIGAVTISGGEPFLQSKQVFLLIEKLKAIRPDVNIWLYSGYTLEELLKKTRKNSSIKNILVGIDVLVDGRYAKEQRDISLEFRGSKNQRIITKKEIVTLLP